MGTGAMVLAVRRKGIGWHVITGLLLLAFAFQSYLTQTHIHATSPVTGGVCISSCAAKVPAKNSAPAGDTENCPLCQAVVHAGAFFVPAIPVVILPRLLVDHALQSALSFVLPAVSARHGHSRAPPLH